MNLIEVLNLSRMSLLRDTPGIFYSLSYSLSLALAVFSGKRRFSRLLSICFLLLYAALLIALMGLTGGTESALIYCLTEVYVLGSMTAMLCALRFIGSVWDAFYHAVRAFILGEFIASMTWQLYYFCLHEGFLPDVWISALAWIALLYSLFYLIFYLLEIRIFPDSPELEVSRHEAFIAFLIGLSFYAVSNLSYVASNSPFSSDYSQEVFIIRTLADFGCVALLEAFHAQLLERKVVSERQFLKRLLQMQYDNYRISEESIALVNQKYHDLKHQIGLLKQDMHPGKSLDSLNEMEREIGRFETRFSTGNPVLDTMLSAKSLLCQNRSITMITVADGESLSFMDPMDLSALFGNALDNAIESVGAIAAPERRLIRVTIVRQKGFCRIRVENCFDGAIRLKNGLPVTTKGDERYHGYGSRSIQQIVRKYNGSLTIDPKDGWYRLKILIPLDGE